VAQNIFLGREPKTKTGFVDKKVLNKAAKDLLDFLHVNIDPNELVAHLGVAHQQLIEVAKALSVNSEILIMDEPTATLSEKEIEILFSTIRNLQGKGVSIIYISHRLQEISLIGNRITVLRDGETMTTCNTGEVSLDEIITMMVGREISKKRIREQNTSLQERSLEVNNVSQGKQLKNISLYVKRGEIVGLAGLVGSGRTELAQAIYGITRIEKGNISINGREIVKSQPRKCIKNKMGFISENRKQYGLALNLPIKVNITSAALDILFSTRIIDNKKEINIAQGYRAKLRMATPDVIRDVHALSGGTQQKVVLAKWLCTDSEFLVFDEPTRGIDVGAKDEIHAMIDDLAKTGVGILMISSDLPEVLSLSDRIYVMREGAIVKELIGSETTQEEVIAYATIGKKE
jgi:ribose transport system ATP-binding protein